MRPVRAMSMTLSAGIFAQHDISSFNDKDPPLTQGCCNLSARFAKNAAQSRGGNIHNRRGLLLRHTFRIDQPQGLQHIQPDAIFPLRDAVLRPIAAAGWKDANPAGFARSHTPSFSYEIYFITKTDRTLCQAIRIISDGFRLSPSGNALSPKG